MAEYNGYLPVTGSHLEAHDVPCAHCERTVGHEPWCEVVNALVWYARAIVNEPLVLSEYDKKLLEVFRILWTP